MLGTSERTVRNYIKAINEEGKAVITSSREGYRLESHTASLDTLPNEAESRVWKVLSDLLTSKEGVNAFDEAEALYVSSSTILNTVIPQVKEIAKEYDLRIESQKYQFYLRGSEQNRRKNDRQPLPCATPTAFSILKMRWNSCFPLRISMALCRSCSRPVRSPNYF